MDSHCEAQEAPIGPLGDDRGSRCFLLASLRSLMVDFEGLYFML